MARDECPCEEAFTQAIPDWRIRTCTEEEYNAKWAEREGGPWASIGTNHHITKKGWIKRQEGFLSAWAVEINTIEELKEFSEKYGKLVFSCEEGIQAIEIYDDYRE